MSVFTVLVQSALAPADVLITEIIRIARTKKLQHHKDQADKEYSRKKQTFERG